MTTFRDEEPGWREYWQSGGNSKKLNKRKPSGPYKYIFYFLILALITFISIKGIKYQKQNTQPINKMDLKQDKDNDISRILTGERAVTAQMEDYLYNLKSFTNSIEDVASNINKNFKDNKTKLNSSQYDVFMENFKLMYKMPAELQDYKDSITQQLDSLGAIIPAPEITIYYDTYVSIIKELNNFNMQQYIAAYLTENGYHCIYDPETKYIQWKIIIDP